MIETRKLSKAERKELYRARCNYCVNPDTSVEDKEILTLHKERIPAVEIAARLNVPPELIRYRLRRMGFEPIPAPKFLRAERLREDILRLHRQRYSAKRIAEELKTDLSYVYKLLRTAELVPHPSPEEIESTVERLDEILSLGKQGLPRYEIAKQVRSTWPLVAESLEKASIRQVVPACGEIASWASTLAPLIDEIRKVAPDTEPVLSKVNELEKELTAITEAAKSVEDRLPWRGKDANKERWCLGDISYLAHRCLELMDALRGCVRTLDKVEPDMLFEQAKTCIANISTLLDSAISEMHE